MSTVIAIFAAIGIITVGLFVYGIAPGLGGRKPPTPPETTRQGEGR